MKNIILLTTTLFLGLSFISCKTDDNSAPEGTLNVLNQSEFEVAVHQGAEEVLRLKNGECASFTQDQLSLLMLKKITGWFDTALDQIICDGSGSNLGYSDCDVKQKSVYTENADGDHVLTEYQAPAEDAEEAEYDFSKCKPLPAEEGSEEEGSEEESEEEEEGTEE